ncbi:O-antigen ligase family protein [Candidatus Saccharibacteria bacterium]|nr:O-antigen ligase family protein [Candidatus Saccharibacteria bacterium]
MKKLYRYLLYIMPLTLCFSYFPVISLGGNETMNFELSLPLLWLVVFDVLSFVMIVRKYRKELFTKVFGSISWWLFPIFVTLSVIWSLNVLRGFLTVGVMWLLFFAVIAFWELRENLDEKFWRNFWKWFFGSALFVCVWCVVQCVLDVAGVSQDVSLLCDGCVYQMFGFPHPNGFAIEPQFMGNLLLAPIIVSFYFYINGKGKKYLGLFLVFTTALFLTFSRGAIYACVVGMVFLWCFSYFKAKKAERKKVCFSILKSLGVFVVAFLFTLNLQGILAMVSPTSDGYFDGVSKVVNHLSLGVIDFRGGEKGKDVSSGGTLEGDGEPVKNSGEGEGKTDGKTEPVFGGYVAESTDTRVRLSAAALDIWKKDFKTVMIGVGIGGAGQALYDNGLSPAPKEIVQNEYMSLLLETGIIGVSLFVLILVFAVKVVLKNREVSGMILALLVAYGVSLLFFSGLPNALHIVLLPGLFMVLNSNNHFLQ